MGEGAGWFQRWQIYPEQRAQDKQKVEQPVPINGSRRIGRRERPKIVLFFMLSSSKWKGTEPRSSHFTPRSIEKPSPPAFQPVVGRLSVATWPVAIEGRARVRDLARGESGKSGFEELGSADRDRRDECKISQNSV
jgi:hypothetical protein